MEQTKVTKVTPITIEKSIEKAKSEKAVIEKQASSIRDGADLRSALARGVDNRVIDELGSTRRGNEVLDGYLKLKGHLSKQAYERSEGLYNEVMPNGDKRRKLSEVNPLTGESTLMTERITKSFTVPHIPWKK